MSDETALAEFITHRLDEWEAIARAAGWNGEAEPWCIDMEGNVQACDTHGAGSAYVACGPYGCGVDPSHAAHIALHDPARVLRQVEAMRKILAECDEWMTAYAPTGAHRILLALAAVWSDHPDFRDDWR